MKKICLLLIVALLLSLTACNIAEDPSNDEGTGSSSGPLNEVPNKGFSKNKYEIYFNRKSGEQAYFSADAVNISNLYPNASAPEPTEQTMTVQINGVGHEMKYVNTLELQKGSYYHGYRSSDKKVTCQYRAKDMQIASLTIDMALADFADMDQQQYEQWIQTFVSQFTQEDLSKLQLSCQTQYNRPEDGFFTEPKGEETIRGYSFRYEKYIASVKTTDAVTASFDIKAEDGVMRVSVAFNEHNFDAFDSLKVDEATVDQVIRDYMSAYMAEHITLDSYETQGEDGLIVIDGNIMLTRTVDVQFKWKGLKKEAVVDLIVDIPDA